MAASRGMRIVSHFLKFCATLSLISFPVYLALNSSTDTAMPLPDRARASASRSLLLRLSSSDIAAGLLTAASLGMTPLGTGNLPDGDTASIDDGAGDPSGGSSSVG